MESNRLHGADFLRAAACLLVLFHHLAQRMSWNQQLPGIEWFRPFAINGSFGVAVFFVLSGFLLARPFWLAFDAGAAMPSLTTYALRRAARILPGFWVALLLSFAIAIAIFGARLDGQLLLRLASGALLVSDWHPVTLFPVEVNGPLWSIGFEVTSYALLPLGFLLLWPMRRAVPGWWGRLAWLGVIGVVLLLHLAFVTWYPMDMRGRGWENGLIGGAKTWMPRYNPFGFFAMFAVGALAAGLQVRLARLRHWAFDLAALAALAGATALLAAQAREETSEGWGLLGIPYDFPWFVLAVGAALATAPSSRLLGQWLDNPVSRYLARISFGIYIWHYPVLELVRRYWAPDMDHGQMGDPVRFVVTSGVILAISIGVAQLSFTFIENPVIRWARRREPSAPAAMATAGAG